MDTDSRLIELIETGNQAILALVKKTGHPHLSNVNYLWSGESRTAAVSTTADRVKGRIVRRDAHAALHVAGDTFFKFAVAECEADPTPITGAPGDSTCRELLAVHSLVEAVDDESAFFARMVEERRLVINLRVQRVYGMYLETPPGE